MLITEVSFLCRGQQEPADLLHPREKVVMGFLAVAAVYGYIKQPMKALCVTSRPQLLSHVLHGSMT